MPSTRRTSIRLCAAASLLVAAAPDIGLSQTRTVVEQMIATQNPCSTLRVNVMGMSVGVDTLDALRVDVFDVSTRGDDLMIELSGRLACRTGSNALAAGDLQASVHLGASVDLASCNVRSTTVELYEIGGSYKDVLEGFRVDAQAAMAAVLQRQITDECRAAKADM